MHSHIHAQLQIAHTFYTTHEYTCNNTCIVYCMYYSWTYKYTYKYIIHLNLLKIYVSWVWWYQYSICDLNKSQSNNFSWTDWNFVEIVPKLCIWVLIGPSWQNPKGVEPPTPDKSSTEWCSGRVMPLEPIGWRFETWQPHVITPQQPWASWVIEYYAKKKWCATCVVKFWAI